MLLFGRRVNFRGVVRAPTNPASLRRRPLRPARAAPGGAADLRSSRRPRAASSRPSSAAGSPPSTRATFQAVALLVRELRDQVDGGEPQRGATQRPAEARSTRSPPCWRGPRPATARCWRCSPTTPRRSTAPSPMLRELRSAAGHGGRAEPEPAEPRSAPADGRAPRGAAVGHLPPAGQSLPRAGLLRATAAPAADPAAVQLGAARPAAARLRDGLGRGVVVHDPSRSRPSLRGLAGPDAHAAPGAGGRGRGRRPPDVPAGRRAGPRQDRPGVARRPGGQRVSAAGRRAERRQDQLGARGGDLDPDPSRSP